MKLFGLLLLSTAIARQSIDKDNTLADTLNQQESEELQQVHSIVRDQHGNVLEQQDDQVLQHVQSIVRDQYGNVLEQQDDQVLQHVQSIARDQLDQIGTFRKHDSVKNRLRRTEAFSIEGIALSAHNQARSNQKIPCTATNMRKLTWDTQLAEMAQEQANKCKWGNSGNYLQLGENIFAEYSNDKMALSNATIEAAITSWMDGRRHFDFENTACIGQCSQYVQMVWSTASKVGCGAATCIGGLEGSYKPFKHAAIVVCNYDKKMKYDTKPFMEGKQCALCPAHCSKGLCVREPKSFIECKDHNDYEYIRNGKSFQGCHELIKGMGRKICKSWPIIGSTYCRSKCKECSVKDYPKGVGREYCTYDFVDPPVDEEDPEDSNEENLNDGGDEEENNEEEEEEENSEEEEEENNDEEDEEENNDEEEAEENNEEEAEENNNEEEEEEENNEEEEEENNEEENNEEEEEGENNEEEEEGENNEEEEEEESNEEEEEENNEEEEEESNEDGEDENNDDEEEEENNDEGDEENSNDEGDKEENNDEDDEDESNPPRVKKCNEFNHRQKKHCINHQDATGKYLCEFKKKKCIPKQNMIEI